MRDLGEIVAGFSHSPQALALGFSLPYTVENHLNGFPLIQEQCSPS
jgi:hypothetical protein